MSNPGDPIVFGRLRDDNTCTIALGDQVLRLKEHPTRQWLDALAEQRLSDIMPGMLRRRDQRWFYRQLISHDTSMDVADTRRIAEEVIRHVTGIPWWAAVRLAHSAASSWFRLDAIVLIRGVDLLAVSIRRTLSAIYALAAEGCQEEKDRAMLDNDIFRPPEGVEVAWTPEQQATSFAAFRAANAQFSARSVP